MRCTSFKWLYAQLVYGIVRKKQQLLLKFNYEVTSATDADWIRLDVEHSMATAKANFSAARAACAPAVANPKAPCTFIVDTWALKGSLERYFKA